jgi:hypothetical protein
VSDCHCSIRIYAGGFIDVSEGLIAVRDCLMHSE